MSKTSTSNQSAAVGRSGSSRVSPGYKQLLQKGHKSSPGKVELREKVLELMLEHHAGTRKKRSQIMTLPGPHWAMEQELFAATKGNVDFVCFEKLQQMMHPGLVNVPRRGEGRRLNTKWYTMLPLDIEVFQTQSARWVHQDVVDFALIGEDRFDPDHYEQSYNAWLSRYWNTDALWLDFTSCLFCNLERMLLKLPKLIGLGCGGDKPTVITVQAAREPKRTTRNMRATGLSRAGYIAWLIDRRPGYTLDVLEEHSYQSLSGMPMVSLIAVWRRDA